MAEAAEVVEREPEPGLIDEDEFARQPNLELALRREHLAAVIRQLDQRLFDCRILERMSLIEARRR
jgi:hypothetical protein